MKKVLLFAISLCVVTLCFAENVTKGENGNDLQCPFYQSYIELSASLTRSSYDIAGGAAIDMINGCRLNKYVFIGGGIGVHSLFAGHNEPSYYEMVATPLYADIRAMYPIKSSNVTPYIEAGVGPLFAYHTYVDGLGKGSYATLAYFKLAVGIDIINRFTIGAGYEMWGKDTSLWGNIHYGYIKFGVRIGQDKNVL